MNDLITTADLILQDEARISSVRLGRALGYASNHQMNKLIKRNMDELCSYAKVAQTERPTEAGQKETEYLLNEQQAIVTVMLSRTEPAKAIRRSMILAFMAMRSKAYIIPPTLAPSPPAPHQRPYYPVAKPSHELTRFEYMQRQATGHVWHPEIIEAIRDNRERTTRELSALLIGRFPNYLRPDLYHIGQLKGIILNYGHLLE